MMPEVNLFGEREWWREHWRGMPEFDQKDLAPRHSVQVDFPKKADAERFAKLLGQTITEPGRRTRSVWFPEAEIGRFADKRYVAGEPYNPRYPLYVISKGRWESRLTVKALEAARIPYHVVVEPQEHHEYAKVIDPGKILVLPFSNLGQGSIPARNWVWEHSIKAGAERHWICDDNISMFLRMNRNSKAPVTSGAVFRAAEDFVDRYENVALAGFNYDTFARRKVKIPPFYLNTRIYSCILILCALPYRWRGRYNEDTDLSIRALKEGWCSILFNAFMAKKMPTMTMKGGNTDELYRDDGRLKMAQSLADQHPDIVRVSWKWGRHQHHVDYAKFKRNKLLLRQDAAVGADPDEYGMTFRVGA